MPYLMIKVLTIRLINDIVSFEQLGTAVYSFATCSLLSKVIPFRTDLCSVMTNGAHSDQTPQNIFGKQSSHIYIISRSTYRLISVPTLFFFLPKSTLCDSRHKISLEILHKVYPPPPQKKKKKKKKIIIIIIKKKLEQTINPLKTGDPQTDNWQIVQTQIRRRGV